MFASTTDHRDTGKLDFQVCRRALRLGKLALLALLISGGVFTYPASAAGPDLVNYQAFLRDDAGLPLDGVFDIELSIFDAESGGSEVWSEIHNGVLVDGGLFHIVLGSATALGSGVFDGSERWLETTVDSEVLAPRRQFLATPYAMRAAVADVALSGGDADSDWVISGSDVYRIGGAVGVGTDSPAADLHLSGGAGSVSVLLEADENDSDESAQPNLRMTQDGGVVSVDLGFLEGENEFRIHHRSPGGDSTYLSIGDLGENVTTNADFLAGGGVLDYDGAAELMILRGQSDDWYMGVRNEFTIEQSDFFIGHASSPDGLFHLRSTGDVGIGTTEPSSKLSVVGDVDATHYSASENLGETADPGVGGMYADNVVYAWAWVRLDGVIIESFGVTDVEHTGTGEYTVNLEREYERTCPMVTVNSPNDPCTANALAWSDHVDVLIWTFDADGPDPSNRNFFVHVMARP